MRDEGKKMRSTVVCVTGGGGFIGSWLVRKLLGRGCVVYATLRSLEEEKKAELLRSLPGAAERLRLFQADMYDADTFEPAIVGCEFVFLVATPLAHDPTSTKYKNTTEATVDAAHHPAAVRALRHGEARHPHGLYHGRLAAERGRHRLQGFQQRVLLDAAQRLLRIQQLSLGRLCVVQVAVGEGAAELQRARDPGVRGGDADLRARRRRHHPAVPVGHHPGDRVAADEPRGPPQLAPVHAGAAGLRAAGARGGRLRGARLLHGPAVHGRPLHLRRRVPQHAGHPRPLRRQAPRDQDTGLQGRRG